MTQEELQNLAIQEADKILKAQGLPTYRVLEERLFMALTACHELFMALTACHESVDMGKMLVKRLTQAEKEIKRLKEKKA